MSHHNLFRRIGILLFVLLIPFSTSTQSQQPTPTPQLKEIAQLGRGTAITVAWSPDGTTLAVGGSLGIWMYSDQLVTLGFQAIDETVQEVKWVSTHSDLLAVHTAIKQADGSSVSTWHFWEWSAEPMTFTPVLTEFDQVGRMEWSADGHYLALQNQNGLHILDLDTYATIAEFTDEPTPQFAWNPNNRQFARLLPDRIDVYDAAAQQLQYTIVDSERPDYRLQTFEWSRDGEKIAVVSAIDYRNPSIVQIYDAEMGQWHKRLVSKATVTPLTWAYEAFGTQLSYYFYSITLICWNRESDHIFIVQGSPESPALGAVIVWDIQQSTIIEKPGLPLTFARAEWSPDDRFVLYSGLTYGASSIGLYVYGSGIENLVRPPYGSRWSFSYNQLLIASYEKSGNSVNVSHLNKTDLPITLKGETDRIQGISWHPDSIRLATVSGDEVIIWDVTNGQILARNTEHLGEWIQLIGWNATGGYLAVADFMFPPRNSQYRINVKIWNTQSHQLQSVLRGHLSIEHFGAHWDASESLINIVTYDYNVTTTWDAYGHRLRIALFTDGADRPQPNASYGAEIEGIGQGVWNPTMTQFATKDDKGVIHLWEVVK